jgi:hypothetical protein
MNLLSEPKDVLVQKEWFLLEQAVCIRMEKRESRKSSSLNSAEQACSAFP